MNEFEIISLVIPPCWLLPWCQNVALKFWNETADETLNYESRKRARKAPVLKSVLFIAPKIRWASCCNVSIPAVMLTIWMSYHWSLFLLRRNGS